MTGMTVEDALRIVANCVEVLEDEQVLNLMHHAETRTPIILDARIRSIFRSPQGEG